MDVYGWPKWAKILASLLYAVLKMAVIAVILFAIAIFVGVCEITNSLGIACVVLVAILTLVLAKDAYDVFFLQ